MFPCQYGEQKIHHKAKASNSKSKGHGTVACRGCRCNLTGSLEEIRQAASRYKMHLPTGDTHQSIVHELLEVPSSIANP